MTRFLDRWIGLADRLATIAARCGGAMILLSALLVGAEVLLRKAFALSIGGADEIGGYAFAIGTSWAFAFTLLRRANVRVDALYSHLPRRLTALLDLLGLLSLGFFVAYLAWRAAAVLQESLLFDAHAPTPLATPLWLPQSLWLLGFGLFVFAILPLILRVALAIAAGDRDTVRALAGARTLEEDAAAEAEHAAALKPLTPALER